LVLRLWQVDVALSDGRIPADRGRRILIEASRSRTRADRGIVFQHFALFPWKSVRANISTGWSGRGCRAPSARMCADLHRMVGLKGFEDAIRPALGGMKQRTAIARTLAFDPAILLMDEPFGALDAQTRSLMQEELLGIWQRTPKTVIFVTTMWPRRCISPIASP